MSGPLWNIPWTDDGYDGDYLTPDEKEKRGEELDEEDEWEEEDDLDTIRAKNRN